MLFLDLLLNWCQFPSFAVLFCFLFRFPRLLILMLDLLFSFAGLAVLLVMAGVSGAAVWCVLSVISTMVSG